MTRRGGCDASIGHKASAEHEKTAATCPRRPPESPKVCPGVSQFVRVITSVVDCTSTMSQLFTLSERPTLNGRAIEYGSIGSKGVSRMCRGRRGFALKPQALKLTAAVESWYGLAWQRRNKMAFKLM